MPLASLESLAKLASAIVSCTGDGAFAGTTLFVLAGTPQPMAPASSLFAPVSVQTVLGGFQASAEQR